MKRRRPRGISTEHIAELVLLGISMVVAVYFVRSGALLQLFSLTSAAPLESFIAGSFFTSVFTTAPAIVALGQIAQHTTLLTVAFYGALGAMCGDVFLLRFTRSALVEDVVSHIVSKKVQRRVTHYRDGPLGWLTAVCGAIIIASPLPDELGLMMMGFSKMRMLYLVPISFCMNFLGIVAIGLTAQALL